MRDLIIHLIAYLIDDTNVDVIAEGLCLFLETLDCFAGNGPFDKAIFKRKFATSFTHRVYVSCCLLIYLDDLSHLF